MLIEFLLVAASKIGEGKGKQAGTEVALQSWTELRIKPKFPFESCSLSHPPLSITSRFPSCREKTIT